jgi:tetratricopeptide (TPR) repeat protein
MELSNIWIFLIVGLIAAYFLTTGYLSENKTTPLPEAAQGSTNATSPAPEPQKSTSPPKAATVPVSNAAVKQSDEEGSRLNLEGYALIQKGDYQNAEGVLRQAVQAFPADTKAVGYKFALYNLGHVLRRRGRPKEALIYLEKAAKLDPEWSKAQSEIAVARQEAANTKVM